MKIQTPTPGRVVLYAPNKMDEHLLAMEGIEAPELQILPATVLRHDGHGVVRLTVAGLYGVFVAQHGEVAPGEPPVGRWCYPPMVREEIEVPDHEPL